MKRTSEHDYRPRVNSTPEERAFLDLMRTADLLSRLPAQLLKTEELSSTQYNVLRILRGAPDGLACGQIGERMITREPDITRLLDRLEKRSLVSRCREAHDRRTVLTRITPEGLKLLARLDERVQNLHGRQLGHLGAARLRELTALLAACRDHAVESGIDASAPNAPRSSGGGPRGRQSA